MFLAIEGPDSPMNIGSVGIFDGPAPTFDEVRTFVGAKLDAVPRCRQRVRESPHGLTRPVWIDDVRFDLDDHLHQAALPLGEPEALERFVEEVMVEPLDRGRALWEMWVVQHLDGGRWAVVSKIHHCMVDGIAGTDLLAVMMDQAPDGAPPPSVAWTPAPEPSAGALACFDIASVTRSIWGHLCRIVRALVGARATWRRLREVVAGAKSLWRQPSRRGSSLTGPIAHTRHWTRTSVPLAAIRSIRHTHGGTVNDAVLAAIAHGFRTLLRARGDAVTGRDVMTLMPVSTRGADALGSLDNRVAVAHALLPVDIADPVATHAALRRHLDQLKASHQTDASTALLHTGNIAPHPISAVVARAVVRAQQNLEAITTNVPGPQHPLYLCGRQMLEAYPFAPIAGHIRIAVAVWSYCGTLYLGVTSDRETASDTDALIRGIDEGFQHLSSGAA